MLRLIVVTVPVGLAACAAGDPGLCPTVVNYDSATENEAAKEINALPPDATLRQWMSDYGRMRSQARDCYATAMESRFPW